MIVIFLRALILYAVVLFTMRLMGKREIGQLQPFELVIAIMIADLGATPMQNTGVPIINGIIPILTLLIVHYVLAAINLKSNKTREIICGKSTMLIENGIINEKELKKQMYTITDLMEQLRIKNVFKLEDVEYAILETSGELSVIVKSNKRNLTPYDMNLIPDKDNFNYEVIIDGKIVYDSLKKINIDEQFINSKLKGKKIRDVLVMTVDENKNAFIQFKVKR